jgi:hypothetical protein
MRVRRRRGADPINHHEKGSLIPHRETRILHVGGEHRLANPGGDPPYAIFGWRALKEEPSWPRSDAESVASPICRCPERCFRGNSCHNRSDPRLHQPLWNPDPTANFLMTHECVRVAVALRSSAQDVEWPFRLGRLAEQAIRPSLCRLPVTRSLLRARSATLSSQAPTTD